MTDCSLVKARLESLFSLNEEEAAGCDSFIEYTVNCVRPMIKEGVDENDIRIIHLCVLKAYYQYLLTHDDFISSFSAGEVSYSVDTCAPLRIKSLLDEAANACKDLMSCDDFAFLVV